MDRIFGVLDDIARRGQVGDAVRDRSCIDALKTICWVVESGSGFALTAEGSAAYQELAAGKLALS